MPRRRVVEKRKILPDPKFQDRTVAKFINNLMRQGKKSTGEKIIYGAFALVENRLKDDPLKVFKKALDNVKPVVEVKSRRVGGATYQVPVEVRQDRRTALAMRWLIEYASARGEKTMVEKLAGGDPRRRQQPRQRGEEARGHPQDGGSEQGVRALPLVVREENRGIEDADSVGRAPRDPKAL